MRNICMKLQGYIFLICFCKSVIIFSSVENFKKGHATLRSADKIIEKLLWGDYFLQFNRFYRCVLKKPEFASPEKQQVVTRLYNDELFNSDVFRGQHSSLDEIRKHVADKLSQTRTGFKRKQSS